jgi:hypothetical protein
MIGLLGGIGLFSASCLPPKTVVDPSTSQIRVRLPLLPDDALKQTRAVFQEQGIDVDMPLKHDSILHVEPYKISRRVQVTYQAVVHPADSGSVVTLSALVYNTLDAAWDQAMLGVPKLSKNVLTKKTKGSDEQAGWQKLEQMAARLRSPAGPAPRKPA